MHVFYNATGLAPINSWILFRDICNSGISPQKFAQRIVGEHTGTAPGDDSGKNAATQRNSLETCKPPEKKRKTCATSKFQNRTMQSCNTCRGTTANVETV